MTPRELTDGEVKIALLEHIWHLIQYWKAESRLDWPGRVEGVAFSILVALDGGSGDLTGFQVIPCPHKDDRACNKEHGENWYPYSKQHPHDVGGALHEQFHDIGRRLGYLPPKSGHKIADQLRERKKK